MQDREPSLWARLTALYRKYEELIRYVVVGGLTTALNYAVYALCLLVIHGDGDYLWGTVISFVVAVIFAYYANKRHVFHSQTADPRDAAREAGSFFLMRAVSFGAELAAMALLVDVLRVNKWLAKIPVNFLIVLLNYGFSKFFIFRKSNHGDAAEEK